MYHACTIRRHGDHKPSYVYHNEARKEARGLGCKVIIIDRGQQTEFHIIPRERVKEFKLNYCETGGRLIGSARRGYQYIPD